MQGLGAQYSIHEHALQITLPANRQPVASETSKDSMFPALKNIWSPALHPSKACLLTDAADDPSISRASAALCDSVVLWADIC